MKIVLVLLLLCKGAFAQIGVSGCVDFRGVPVTSLINVGLQDVAMATYAANGAPIIVYNPQVLSWVSEPTRRFFYAHECAHHVLAHAVRNVPLQQEQEADCWAVQRLVSSGQFGDDDLAAVQQDIFRFARGDWQHLPGPIRAINLQACLANVSSPRRGGRERGAESNQSRSDACWSRCEARQDRCIDRCPSGDAWDACYDRCQHSFDACSDRCD